MFKWKYKNILYFFKIEKKKIYIYIYNVKKVLIMFEKKFKIFLFFIHFVNSYFIYILICPFCQIFLYLLKFINMKRFKIFLAKFNYYWICNKMLLNYVELSFYQNFTIKSLIKYLFYVVLSIILKKNFN